MALNLQNSFRDSIGKQNDSNTSHTKKIHQHQSRKEITKIYIFSERNLAALTEKYMQMKHVHKHLAANFRFTAAHLDKNRRISHGPYRYQPCSWRSHPGKIQFLTYLLSFVSCACYTKVKYVISLKLLWTRIKATVSISNDRPAIALFQSLVSNVSFTWPLWRRWMFHAH